MASWDDDNFEPAPVVVEEKPAVTDKWEGEDEEDEVKDNWEDEEEEKSKEEENPGENGEVVQAKPKKKSLAEKIAEKERQKREELEQRLKEEESELSPEERLKQQHESDLNLFVETTIGGADFGSDLTCPTTKDEFDEFGANLAKKIQTLSKNIEYPNFAENLIRDICATLTSHDIKKVKTTIDNLYLEKQKVEKGDKTKKNKGKGKVKLKMEDENQFSAYAVDSYNEYDDFM